MSPPVYEVKLTPFVKQDSLAIQLSTGRAGRKPDKSRATNKRGRSLDTVPPE